MNLKRILLFLAVPLALAGGLSVSLAQSVDTLGIGIIGSDADQNLYQAAVLAAEQINAGDDDDLDGVETSNDERYNLNIVFYPAQTREDAVDALEEAVNEDMIAILGPADDDQAEAIADEGTPDVAVIFAQPDAPEGTRLLRAVADYENWAQAAADYLEDERGFTRISVVAVNTSTAEDGIEAFTRATGDDVIVVELTHEADEDDFDEIAQTIRDADTQALFAWTLDTAMIDLLDALRSSGWDGVVVYPGLDADFVSDAGELAQDVIGITSWSPAAYDSTSQTFVRDYVERWGEMPTDTAAVYYDAVYRIADAIERGGDTAAAMASQLGGSTEYTGVQGEYSGIETDALRLVQVEDDGLIVEAARYSDDTCANCPDTWWPDTAADDESSSSTLNIGLIAAGDGPTENLADNIEQAARLAIREINDAGGILRSGTRYTLNLQVYSATTGEEAETAFQNAIDDGAQVVLGPDYNGQVLPNLTAAASNEIVQLVSATNPQITATESEDYVYQIRATDDALVEAVAEYLLDSRELTEFASVAVRTDYGFESVDTFADTIAASDDGRLTLELDHALDASSEQIAALAEEIAASDVEAVGVWTAQPAAQTLLAALNALNWEGVFAYGYLTPDFMTADGTVEVLGPVNWSESAGDWTSQDFAARYAERYGETPAPQSAAYYDAVYLVAAALLDTGEDIQNGLQNLDSFNGVQGTYSPNGDGELTEAVVVVGMSDGQVVELARYNGETCLVGCEA